MGKVGNWKLGNKKCVIGKKGKMYVTAEKMENENLGNGKMGNRK